MEGWMSKLAGQDEVRSCFGDVWRETWLPSLL